MIDPAVVGSLSPRYGPPASPPPSLLPFFSSSKEPLLATPVFRRPGDSDRALSFERTAHALQDSVRAGNYAISGMPCIARFSLFAALTKVLHTAVGYWEADRRTDIVVLSSR